MTDDDAKTLLKTVAYVLRRQRATIGANNASLDRLTYERDLLSNTLAINGTNPHPPEVKVVNESPPIPITVNVDMQPVADALRRMADAIVGNNDILLALVNTLSSKLSITTPPAQIQVTVEKPDFSDMPIPRVDVHVEKQPTPIVNIPKPTRSYTVVERDEAGEMTKTTTEYVYDSPDEKE